VLGEDFFESLGEGEDWMIGHAGLVQYHVVVSSQESWSGLV